MQLTNHSDAVYYLSNQDVATQRFSTRPHRPHIYLFEMKIIKSDMRHMDLTEKLPDLNLNRVQTLYHYFLVEFSLQKGQRHFSGNLF